MNKISISSSIATQDECSSSRDNHKIDESH